MFNKKTAKHQTKSAVRVQCNHSIKFYHAILRHHSLAIVLNLNYWMWNNKLKCFTERTWLIVISRLMQPHDSEADTAMKRLWFSPAAHTHNSRARASPLRKCAFIFFYFFISIVKLVFEFSLNQIDAPRHFFFECHKSIQHLFFIFFAGEKETKVWMYEINKYKHHK